MKIETWLIGCDTHTGWLIFVRPLLQIIYCFPKNTALQYYQQATCNPLNGLRDKQQSLFIASQSLRYGVNIA